MLTFISINQQTNSVNENQIQTKQDEDHSDQHDHMIESHLDQMIGNHLLDDEKGSLLADQEIETIDDLVETPLMASDLIENHLVDQEIAMIDDQNNMKAKQIVDRSDQRSLKKESQRNILQNDDVFYEQRMKKGNLCLEKTKDQQKKHMYQELEVIDSLDQQIQIRDRTNDQDLNEVELMLDDLENHSEIEKNLVQKNTKQDDQRAIHPNEKHATTVTRKNLVAEVNESLWGWGRKEHIADS